MIDKIKSISLFIVIGIVATGLSNWLKSPFLQKFLIENLITLLIALLAINTTTMSVIMTKLKEISKENKVDFTNTIHSMKNSIFEQLCLIIFSVVVLVLRYSPVCCSFLPYSEFIFNCILVAIFAYSVQILYDTAHGIFVILAHENH